MLRSIDLEAPMRIGLLFVLLSGCGAGATCGEGTVLIDDECRPEGTVDPDDTDLRDSDALQHRLGAGGAYSCAIDDAGKATCWGPGPANAWHRDIAEDVPDDVFTAIDTNGEVACGLLENGFVTCWGSDYAGLASQAPTVPLTSVSLGFNYGCGLGTDGAVVCWGDDVYGALTGAPPGKATAVESGLYGPCAVLDSGAVDCWGLADNGRTAVPATIFGEVVELAAAAAATCALLTDGSITCWGEEMTSWTRQGAVYPPAGSFQAIRAGHNHVCALDAASMPTCWGQNNFGQASLAPKAALVDIALGTFHTIALTAAGEVLCWGGGDYDECVGAP